MSDCQRASGGGAWHRRNLDSGIVALAARSSATAVQDVRAARRRRGAKAALRAADDARRQSGSANRGDRLGAVALTRTPVRTDDLQVRDHSAFELHQPAQVRHGRLPADGEVPALPAIGRACLQAMLLLGGAVDGRRRWRHHIVFGFVPDQENPVWQKMRSSVATMPIAAASAPSAGWCWPAPIPPWPPAQ